MIMRIVKFFVTRVLVIYLCIYILSWVIIDQHQLYEASRIRTLNSLKPLTYGHLLSLARGEPADLKKLKIYDTYFRTVADFLPLMPEAHSMRGFCAYYMGRPDDAIAAYEQAIALNPQFFWYYHNLGILLFQQGHYERAVEVLETALSSPPDMILKLIQSSVMIYRHVLYHRSPEELSDQHRHGRRDSYVLIAESLYQLKRYHDVISLTAALMNEDVDDQHYFLYKAGQAAYALGKYSLAADFLKEYLTVMKDPGALSLFAQALHQAGQVDLAEPILRQVHNVSTFSSPEDARPYQVQLQPY